MFIRYLFQIQYSIFTVSSFLFQTSNYSHTKKIKKPKYQNIDLNKLFNRPTKKKTHKRVGKIARRKTRRKNRTATALVKQKKVLENIAHDKYFHRPEGSILNTAKLWDRLRQRDIVFDWVHHCRSAMTSWQGAVCPGCHLEEW